MKKIPFICLGLALTVWTAGCTKSNPEAEATPDKGEQAETGPVQITVFSAPGDSEASWNDRYGDAIKKKFPNVTFKFISPRGNDALRIDNFLASGETVDLYYESIGGYFGTLPKYNLQFDHTDLIKKYQVDLDTFEPSLIDALKTNGNGQIWGLPVNNNNMVLYYNKDIFDKFGVPYLKDGMTWDEVIDISKKFNQTVDGKQYIGLIVSPKHIMNVNQFSIPYVDPKTKLPSYTDSNWNESWKTLLQTSFIQPASDSGYKAKIEQLGKKLPYANEWQKTYEAAMYAHLSNLPFINEPEFLNMNFDMVSLPTYKQLPGVGSQMYPTYFSTTSLSKHKDIVFQMIKYLTSEEYQNEYSKKGVMPVLKNDSLKKSFATETKYKDKNINFGAVFYNKPAPISPKSELDSPVQSTIVSKLVDLSLGNMDPNTALRTAYEEGEKEIQKNKK
ncbi:extracellular solute-binding protein [Paenibacillus aurantius]|uniref:Extracellular solute-binding protein n=1 Tax=Paenibacillus aurantius TaxID=2918900 RepID=A0AA96RH33_9BACL|nr:extracellular solute-binding protein [Paenibacillus aurantius]WNQ13136.1 extracellular solute-binding protein [Paenibacillus aurantius]